MSRRVLGSSRAPLFRWIATALFLCCAALAARAQAPISPPIAQVFVGGIVHAVAVQADGKVVIGGQFTHVAGVARSNIARLNADGTLDLGWNPGAGGYVNALAVGGDGSIYVGGFFFSIGGLERENIARLSANGAGEADPDWNPRALGFVSAIALDGLGNVYVGGGFGQIGGQSRSNIAKLSASGSGAADPTWNPGSSGGVSALALEGSHLYVGGWFDVGGGPLARISTATGANDSSWTPNVSSSIVRAMALDGLGALYVGGDFVSVGGQPREKLAKVSTSGAGAVDASWNPAPSGGIPSVGALRLVGGSLYVGGTFASIGGENRSGLARISTTGSGLADPSWDPGPDDGVNALALDAGGRLHVGGMFQSIGGQTKGGIAVLDTATATAGAGWPLLVASNSTRAQVSAIARDATGRTIIGGRFVAVGDKTTARANLARFNADGTLDAAWNPGSNGTIRSLAVDSSGDVYAGGVFTRIGGQTRGNIAKLSGSGSGGADLAWNPSVHLVSGFGGPLGVASLVLDGAGALYAGGSFDSIAGQARTNLAKLSTAGAGAVDPWNPAPNGTVAALRLDAGNLYVGGSYSSIGGVARNNIARISTGTGVVDGTWNPNADGAVVDLAFDGNGNVFAAGGFVGIGGRAVRPSVAKLSASGTGAADESWNPFINGGPVNAVAVGAGFVYLGGPFTEVDFAKRNKLARVSASGAGTVDASWNPNLEGDVSVLRLDGSGLYVGGTFYTVGGQPQSAFAVFRAPSPPGAPLIGAAASGNNLATITFAPPADNGGVPITGYTATCNPGGIAQSGSASPITVTGLANGTPYTCTITATNSAGTGPASAPSNVVTPAPSAPNAPVIGVAKALNASASVAFSAPANNGGSAITSYTATSTPGGISASGPASPIIVPGLANGTAYTFTVTATNAIGTGPASAASNSVTPLAPVAPGAPFITRAAPANGQATIHFDAPLDDGRSTITGYGVTCSPGSVSATGAASPITVTGLVNETTYTCTVSAINAVGTGSASAPVTVKPTANPAPQLVFIPVAIDFGGQSMGTTSPPITLTVSNPGAGTLAINSVSVSSPRFAQTNNCSSVPPGGSCAVNVTFTPPPSSSPPFSSSGTLGVNGDVSGTVPLSGTGERSLVTHYYRSILRRDPDAGGKTFWTAEAARAQALGINVNEVWFAMAQAFYFSSEYAAQNRNSAGFITDLYNTFFGRPPDGAGMAFWVGLLDSGMPREVLLAEFMFSAEFRNFTQAIFGTPNTRAEVDAVVDFYRGLLSRLPDSGGFGFWVGRFRAAQCLGPAAIVAEAELISKAYADSDEYGNRARTNAQFVGDLYNAFLRRGGDLPGVSFWIGSLTGTGTLTLTRDAIRQRFVNSPEFQARVNAIIAQGCLTP